MLLKNKKTKIKFKVDNLLKQWCIYYYLRSNSLIIFCQKLILNTSEDLKLTMFLNDNKSIFKLLNINLIKIIFNKKFFRKIKNFNYIIIFQNFKKYNILAENLKKYNILVLGYYINNFMFYKKDFNIDNMKKEKIIILIKNLIIKKIIILNKLFFLLKFFIKIIINIFKIKYGYYKSNI